MKDRITQCEEDSIEMAKTHRRDWYILLCLEIVMAIALYVAGVSFLTIILGILFLGLGGLMIVETRYDRRMKQHWEKVAFIINGLRRK